MEALDLASSSLCLAFLSYASLRDLKTREVPDRVWAILAPAGLILTSARVAYSRELLAPALVSIALASAIALAAFYAGLYGGADAKALISIALTTPTTPRGLQPPLGYLHPFLPLTAFYNTLLLAALSTLYLAARNLAWAARGRSLFQGLEQEATWRKAIALLSGYKTPLPEVEARPHLYPLEEVRLVEGRRERRLRVFVKVEAERAGLIEDLKSWSQGRSLDVWVTPGLPLVAFMAAGFASSLLLGDMVFYLILRASRLL